MVVILHFNRLIWDLNMHRTLNPFWQRLNVFFVMFRPSLCVFFYIIYNLYKSITPFERSVFPKFWTFKKKWFNVISIYYINVARNDMSSRTVVVGLRRTSIHLRTTLQMFGSNGLCIIVRNTREDFNLNYGRIKDWTFFGWEYYLYLIPYTIEIAIIWKYWSWSVVYVKVYLHVVMV